VHNDAVVAGGFCSGGVGVVAVGGPSLHDCSRKGHARRADHEDCLSLKL
jgi:hypothetical protein